MRVRWSGRRRPSVPPEVVAAIAPTDGERLLAWARGVGGWTVVTGRFRLYVTTDALGDGEHLSVARPWHLVDSGTWSEAAELTVVWVDGEPPVKVTLEDPGMVPDIFRERVQSSVVLAETVPLGPRRSAKVVVRRDLQTGAMLSQAVLGRGVRTTDPGVMEQVRAGLDRVREQVGLD